MNVVAKESHGRERVDSAVCETGSFAAMSIGEGARKGSRDTSRDKSDQKQECHSLFWKTFLICVLLAMVDVIT